MCYKLTASHTLLTPFDIDIQSDVFHHAHLWISEYQWVRLWTHIWWTCKWSFIGGIAGSIFFLAFIFFRDLRSRGVLSNVPVHEILTHKILRTRELTLAEAKSLDYRLSIFPFSRALREGVSKKKGIQRTDPGRTHQKMIPVKVAKHPHEKNTYLAIDNNRLEKIRLQHFRWVKAIIIPLPCAEELEKWKKFLFNVAHKTIATIPRKYRAKLIELTKWDQKYLMLEGELKLYFCQIQVFRRDLTQALKWAKCKVGSDEEKLALRELGKDLEDINPAVIPPKEVEYQIEKINATLENDCDSAERINQCLGRLNISLDEAEQYIRKKLAIELGRIAENRAKSKEQWKHAMEYAKIADNIIQLSSNSHIVPQTFPNWMIGWPQLDVNNIHFSLDKIYSKHLDELRLTHDSKALQQVLLRVVRDKIRGGSIYSAYGLKDNTLLYAMKEDGQKRVSAEVISGSRNHHSICAEFDFGTEYDFINVI